jgi:hypothetical protein
MFFLNQLTGGTAPSQNHPAAAYWQVYPEITKRTH